MIAAADSLTISQRQKQFLLTKEELCLCFGHLLESRELALTADCKWAKPRVAEKSKGVEVMANHKDVKLFYVRSCPDDGEIISIPGFTDVNGEEMKVCAKSQNEGTDFYFKDISRLEPRGRNLEMKLEDMIEEEDNFRTPKNLFFLRSNTAKSLKIDESLWVLHIIGDALEQECQLNYEYITTKLPSHTVFSYLECAGNQRDFFRTVANKNVRGTPWQTGAIGMAEWRGVRLKDVLALVGIEDKDDAVDVQLIGLDPYDNPDDQASGEATFRRPIPIEKALDPDTILAYEMNGECLPFDHGFPLRAIVPGWVGGSYIKWLGRIEVSSKKISSHNNTRSYVLIGDNHPPQRPACGEVANLQTIKSALALTRDTSDDFDDELIFNIRLSEYDGTIRGYAHSPHGEITKVEWKVDDEEWQQAQVDPQEDRYAWTSFSFNWEDPEPGKHIIVTRATDEEGNTQREKVPFNHMGYLFNQPLPHKIRVTE